MIKVLSLSHLDWKKECVLECSMHRLLSRSRSPTCSFISIGSSMVDMTKALGIVVRRKCSICLIPVGPMSS
ncbi:hypothetical protein LINGRAHAP2_LOCUS7875 [Linum grandiflorum]